MELVFKNITKSFENTLSHFILSIPELKLFTGEIVSVVGLNGSGKSVLLKVLTGNLSSETKIKRKPETISSSILRQNASDNLSSELTVFENIIINKPDLNWIDKVFPRRLKKEAEQLINEHPTLKDKMNEYVGNLSGGQQQALAFYLLSYKNPLLICLDEFLSAIDKKLEILLLHKLNELKIDRCIINVTHDLNQAISISDRIIVLEAGKIKHILIKDQQNWRIDFIVNSL